MDCKNCFASKICIVAEMIKNHSMCMNIEVTDCQIKNNLANDSKNTSANASINAPGLIQTVFPPIIKHYVDYNQASNELRNEEKGADCKVRIIESAEEDGALDNVKCPSCDAITTPHDIAICQGENCNKIICSNCGTEVNGKRLCSSCWDKL